MNGYDIRAIAKQPRIDWLAYPPRERAWIYIERNKGYWHSVCRRYTLNWEEARELFGDIILLQSLKHSDAYDEIYGIAFTTFMQRRLLLDIRRTVTDKLRRKIPKTYAFTNLPLRNKLCDELGITNGEDLALEKGERVEYEVKETLREALARLKEEDIYAHDIFIDHTLNNYDKKLLSAKYRCTKYIIDRYLDFARRYLAKYIGHER